MIVLVFGVFGAINKSKRSSLAGGPRINPRSHRKLMDPT
jgi:hypothetical protein